MYTKIYTYVHVKIYSVAPSGIYVRLWYFLHTNQYVHVHIPMHRVKGAVNSHLNVVSKVSFLVVDLDSGHNTGLHIYI